MPVQRSELAIAGVGVRVEVDDGDPAAAVVLGQSGHIGHRRGVVTPENDRHRSCGEDLLHGRGQGAQGVSQSRPGSSRHRRRPPRRGRPTGRPAARGADGNRRDAGSRRTGSPMVRIGRRSDRTYRSRTARPRSPRGIRQMSRGRPGRSGERRGRSYLGRTSRRSASSLDQLVSVVGQSSMVFVTGVAGVRSGNGGLAAGRRVVGRRVVGRRVGGRRVAGRRAARRPRPRSRHTVAVTSRTRARTGRALAATDCAGRRRRRRGPSTTGSG